MSSVRVVRPRPLGLDDRIPVYWSGKEAPAEIRAVDGGALYRYLQEQDTLASRSDTKKRPRSGQPRYKAPKQAKLGQRNALEGAATQRIHIPGVRETGDYAANEASIAARGPQIAGDVATAPYVRYQDPTPGMDDDAQPAEYDVDSDDEPFLAKWSGKENGRGLVAAAVGLYHHMAARFGRQGSLTRGTPARGAGAADGVPAGSGAPSPEPKLTVSVDEFEHAVDRLEAAHFDALQAWWERTGEGPSTSAPSVPRLPTLKALVPRARAAELLPGLDRKLAAALYDHWAKRRAAFGGPLLPRLWYEQPWKTAAFAHLAEEGDESGDEHLPFSASEPRNSGGAGARGMRRRVTDEDALEALRVLRSELEMVRTLADQVRRREKLKRTLALLWRDEWQLRLRSGATLPLPKRRRTDGAAAAAAASHAAAQPAAPRGRPTSATAEARAAMVVAAAAAAAATAAAAPAEDAPSSPEAHPSTGQHSDASPLTPWGRRRKRMRQRGPASRLAQRTRSRRGGGAPAHAAAPQGSSSGVHGAAPQPSGSSYDGASGGTSVESDDEADSDFAVSGELGAVGAAEALDAEAGGARRATRASGGPVVAGLPPLYNHSGARRRAGAAELRSRRPCLQPPQQQRRRQEQQRQQQRQLPKNGKVAGVGVPDAAKAAPASQQMRAVGQNKAPSQQPAARAPAISGSAASRAHGRSGQATTQLLAAARQRLIRKPAKRAVTVQPLQPLRTAPASHARSRVGARELAHLGLSELLNSRPPVRLATADMANSKLHNGQYVRVGGEQEGRRRH